MIYFINIMIADRKYLQNVCKNKKSLFQPIGLFTIKIMHKINERPVSNTYLWNMIKYLSINIQYIL